MVLGSIQKAFDYVISPQTELFIVNFIADGFYRFFSKAILNNREIVDPDILTGEH